MQNLQCRAVQRHAQLQHVALHWAVQCRVLLSEQHRSNQSHLPGLPPRHLFTLRCLAVFAVPRGSLREHISPVICIMFRGLQHTREVLPCRIYECLGCAVSSWHLQRQWRDSVRGVSRQRPALSRRQHVLCCVCSLHGVNLRQR
jgi:hypothetical protein